MKTFEEIRDEANDLKSQQTGRNELFDEMEAMYFMEPQDRGRLARVADNTKLTISPDAAAMLDGAVRLLVASNPKFKVSNDVENHDEIEEFADAMWQGSGEIAGTPAHYDPILSGLLYGESHLAVISMRKLAERMTGKVNDKLTEMALAQTPYLFETWSPRTCFARRGRLGLTAHYREVETTAGRVREDWGDKADKLLGQKSYRDPVTYCEWWDAENQCAWVGQTGEPIFLDEHGLPFIPIVHAVTEGSTSLFTKPEHQLRPFLYKVAKSGLWNRDNLLMTVFFTLVFAMGGNPMYKFRSPTRKQIDVDWSKPGGVIALEPNEDFDVLSKQVIDPSIMQGKQIIDEKMSDMTMYKQALGQPLRGDAPYSTVALLSQSGRLPLASPQRRLGWMIARAMWTAFMWMKEEKGGKQKSRYYRELDPKLIPDDLDLTVDLDVNLPQDRLSQAHIASILMQTGLVSREWVQTNLLDVPNSGKMAEAIIRDRFTDMLTQMVSEQMAAQAQMEQQPQPQGRAGGVAPNIPPEQLAAGMQGPDDLAAQMGGA